MHVSISPLPQYAFVAWCSVKKHRDNFTFTFYLFISLTNEPPPPRICFIQRFFFFAVVISSVIIPTFFTTYGYSIHVCYRNGRDCVFVLPVITFERQIFLKLGMNIMSKFSDMLLRNKYILVQNSSVLSKNEVGNFATESNDSLHVEFRMKIYLKYFLMKFIAC
jgi:hypothetical protein